MPSNEMPQSLQPNHQILPLFNPNAGSGPTKEESSLTGTIGTVEKKCRSPLFSQLYGKCKYPFLIGFAYVNSNMTRYKNIVIKILQILCLSVCTLLPVLAIHFIGYVAIGGWDTYWAYDIWVYGCVQMFHFLCWLTINLIRVMGWWQSMLKPITWKGHCVCYLLIALLLLILAFRIEELGRKQRQPLIHSCNARDFNCNLIGCTSFIYWGTELLLLCIYKTNA